MLGSALYPAFGMMARQQAQPQPVTQQPPLDFDPDMAAAMAMMRGGGFDPMGRYGITDEQNSAARGAGISALGQALAMGAMSGDWGQAGLALNQGIAGMRSTRDAALDKYSGQNMEAEKFEMDREAGMLNIEGAKLNLQKAKEDMAMAKEQRKAALAAFDEQFSSYNEMLSELPSDSTDRKIIESKLRQMRIYIGAGDVARAEKIAAEVEVEYPQYRDRANEIEAARVRSKLDAEAEGRMAVNERYSGVPGRWVNGSFVPYSPEELEKIEHDERMDDAQLDIHRRNVAVAEGNLELNRGRPPGGRGKPTYYDTIPTAEDVRELSSSITTAVDQYNEAVRAINALDPKVKRGFSWEKGFAVDGMGSEAYKAAMQAAGHLKSLGITAVPGKPITMKESDALRISQDALMRRHKQNAEIESDMEITAFSQLTGLDPAKLKIVSTMAPEWLAEVREEYDKARTPSQREAVLNDIEEEISEALKAVPNIQAPRPTAPSLNFADRNDR